MLLRQRANLASGSALVKQSAMFFLLQLFFYSLPGSRASKGTATADRTETETETGTGREGTKNTRRESRQAARLGSTNEDQAAEQTKRSQKGNPAKGKNSARSTT